MRNTMPFIDASLFLGMHHGDRVIRTRSLDFFHGHFTIGARMNFEQIGICDSVIWRQPRETQDDYYPFMDVLHTDMTFVRQGYETRHLLTAYSDERLAHLRAEQKLLVAQVLAAEAKLYTHDPALRSLPCLAEHLGSFDESSAAGSFPTELENLYHRSKAFLLTDEEWFHVN